jgi:carboxyl-terminal processing protease
VNFDTDDLNYPATAEEKKEAWRKEMKFLVLERYADLREQREKNKGKEGTGCKN